MRRYIIGVLLYLGIAGGVAVGYYVNFPRPFGLELVVDSVGIGLIWPVPLIEFIVNHVGGYYGDVSR